MREVANARAAPAPPPTSSTASRSATSLSSSRSSSSRPSSTARTSLAGFYGIALAALGMLSTLATCLAIDVYGPVCDNAGGIAEMCELHPSVREKTDALDAAGNTTAAIGKGFAIGSACLVGLALFGAFVTRLNDARGGHMAVDLLDPLTFAGPARSARCCRTGSRR